MNKKYGNGFTLAEVLITLGVIGVVAAITMPVLIKNYQKHVWVNALKANYSILNQGFQKAMADSGVDDLANTDMFSKLPANSYCSSSQAENHAYCKEFFTEFRKYFKVVSIEKLNNFSYKALTGIEYGNGQYSSYAINLSNGARIFSYNFRKTDTEYYSEGCQQIKTAGGHLCSDLGGFLLDVNGAKGPNILGRDIFMFLIGENGVVVPQGGKDTAIYWKIYLGSDFWDWHSWGCDKVGEDAEYQGENCAGRVIEEGWKMTY